MTRTDRLLIQMLTRRFGLKGELAERLLEAGVIDRCGAERQAIRDRVEECVRGGMKRCEAMEGVAVEYCCSYEKVRNAVYARK